MKIFLLPLRVIEKIWGYITKCKRRSSGRRTKKKKQSISWNIAEHLMFCDNPERNEVIISAIKLKGSDPQSFADLFSRVSMDNSIIIANEILEYYKSLEAISEQDNVTEVMKSIHYPSLHFKN